MGLRPFATYWGRQGVAARAEAEFVIGAYDRLYEIERSFRMCKHDLAARPIYHQKRKSIEAHLMIVFAALAVSRHTEDRTGWSIRKFVQTAAATAPSRSTPAPNC